MADSIECIVNTEVPEPPHTLISDHPSETLIHAHSIIAYLAHSVSADDRMDEDEQYGFYNICQMLKSALIYERDRAQVTRREITNLEQKLAESAHT